jgi:hypothetical protein
MDVVAAIEDPDDAFVPHRGGDAAGGTGVAAGTGRGHDRRRDGWHSTRRRRPDPALLPASHYLIAF